MHAYGHSQANKIEERINFAVRHAHVYIAESDDEQDDKSAAANKI